MVAELKKVQNDHDYCVKSDSEPEIRCIEGESWKLGRRLVEWEVLFENLRYCKNCRLRPVTLSVNTIRGELQKGMSGYLYVECQNCCFVNTAAYGKTHLSLIPILNNILQLNFV
jgi:hypothetical protein